VRRFPLTCAWNGVIAVLDAGKNPYATGGPWGDPILRWLPFWLPILTTIRAAGAALGLSLTESVQAFLIAAECGVIASTAALLRQVCVRESRALLLAGIACNPVCILLVVHALIEAQGAFWLHRFRSEAASLLAILLRTHKVKTLLRLPLFLAYGSMLAGVVMEIRLRMTVGGVDTLRKDSL